MYLRGYFFLFLWHASHSTQYFCTLVIVRKSYRTSKKDIIVKLCDFFSSRSLRRVRKEVVSPHDTLRLLKQPRGDTRSAVRSADYMEQTLRLLQERVHHVHKRSLNATGQTHTKTNTHTQCSHCFCDNFFLVMVEGLRFQNVRIVEHFKDVIKD